MKLNNKVYDILKWISLLLLPALGTLYFALSSIWGLPYGEQVVGTITAIDTFLGAILGLSNASYKGEGEFRQVGQADYRISLEQPIEKILESKKVVLEVRK